MNRHALLVGFNNQLNHLVVVVVALHTVIAGLVQVVLVLPTRVCLGHTIEERLGSDNMEILTTQFGTLCGNAGNLCLRVGNIVGNVHISIGTYLQLAFLLQFIVGLGTILAEEFHTSVGYGCIAILQGEILPRKQVALGILHRTG